MIKEKDYSVSFARFVAMCMIILCHIMQMENFTVYGIQFTFWFNVGVQMFLFISGFLYGNRIIDDVLIFYKKALNKILVDYYVFILIMIPIYFIWDRKNININSAISLLTFSSSVKGLGHLWFIATIIICYLLTPLFLAILNKRNDLGIKYLLFTLLFSFITFLVIYKHFSSFNGIWICCYLLGMVYKRLQDSKVTKQIFITLFTIIAIIGVPIQVYIEKYYFSDFGPVVKNHLSVSFNVIHGSLGIILVILMMWFYKKLLVNFSIVKRLLNWSDKYSYDVYLVHHVFIQSSFACVVYVNNKFIALPLAIILTVISATALNHISSFIRTLKKDS